MRRWHRSQVTAINKRLPRKGPGSLNLVKVALIEHLANHARRSVHSAVKLSGPFDWKHYCEAVMKELVEVAESEPSDSLRTSSGCDTEDKAAADSREDSADSKSEPSAAKA